MIAAIKRIRTGIAGAALPFSGWYGLRSRREQALLQCAAAAVLVFGFQAAVHRPLTAGRDAAEQRIARYDAVLQQLGGLPADGADAVAASASVPLATLVTETAALNGLTIRRLEPGDRDVSMTIDDAPADAVFTWLDALASDDGVTATAVRLERLTAPGSVSAALTLTRGLP